MIRDLRRSDAPRLIELLEQNFPEESALVGNRPEAFEEVARRVFRWDTRLVLGFLRLTGRPIFRYLVVEEAGTVVATTLVTFPARAAYVSNVIVDPAHRRRGYAKRMLERARDLGRRARRGYLALDVLDSNTPARTLYESLGFRPLRASSDLMREGLAEFTTARPPAGSGIRPFVRSDAPAIVAIARRQAPVEVERVLPIGRSAFLGSALASRMLATEDAAWVVDRGAGAEGYIAGNVSHTTLAGHLSAPVLSERLDPAFGMNLTRTALGWCASHEVPRVLCRVAEYNTWGRAPLDALGFRLARSGRTLYRSID